MPQHNMMITRAARELVIEGLEIPEECVITYGTPVAPECWFAINPPWASCTHDRNAQELLCMVFYVERAVLRLYDNGHSTLNSDPCLSMMHHYDNPGGDREVAAVINAHLKRMKWAIDTWSSSRIAAQL